MTADARTPPTSHGYDGFVPGDGFYEWYYVPAGGFVPPIGQRVHGGTYNTSRLTVPGGAGKPARAAVVERGGGAPMAGGAVQRGGFGMSAGGRGGGS